MNGTAKEMRSEVLTGKGIVRFRTERNRQGKVQLGVAMEKQVTDTSCNGMDWRRIGTPRKRTVQVREAMAWKRKGMQRELYSYLPEWAHNGTEGIQTKEWRYAHVGCVVHV